MCCGCLTFGHSVTFARVLNLVLVLCHFLQAAVIYLLAERGNAAKTADIEYPLVKTVVRWYAAEELAQVSTGLPSVVLDNRDGVVVMQPALSATGMKLSTVYLIFFFCILSGTGQLYFAASDVVRWLGKVSGRFSTQSAYKVFLLRGGVNWFRYVEYSISASLMLVLITLQLGVWEWGVLVGIATSTWACMMFGLFADIFMHLDRVWYGVLAHLCGWVCLAGPFWVILATYDSFKHLAPDFVSIIVTIEVILFNGFGLTQLIQVSLSAWVGVTSFKDTSDAAVESDDASNPTPERAALLPTLKLSIRGLTEVTTTDDPSKVPRANQTWSQWLNSCKMAMRQQNYIGVFAETSYVIQSFLSKTLLVWLVYGLVLSRQLRK